MSKRTDRELLGDLREAIRRISTYLAGVQYESFVKDTKTQDAVIRNLEVLGEATKNLSATFRATHADVPWKNLAGARDRFYVATRERVYNPTLALYFLKRLAEDGAFPERLLDDNLAMDRNRIQYVAQLLPTR